MLKSITCICGLTLLLSFTTFGQITMAEQSSKYGFYHELFSWEVGCGISFQDFDNDGMDDITLGSEKGRGLVFYRNTGTSLELLSPPIINTENVRQILWVDFDNDGDLDLYISAYDGQSRLYRQDLEFTFKDVTDIMGLPMDDQRCIGVTWSDINRDGWLDLFYSTRPMDGSDQVLSRNRLFINLCSSFNEVSKNYSIEDNGRAPFCAGALDINMDLWPDLYIANDRKRRNTLLQNSSGNDFDDISDASGSGLLMNAMCVTPWDIDGNGKIDIYITNTGDLGNKLLMNYSDSTTVYFQEESEKYSLEYYQTGWSSVFFDADNDKDADLFISGTASQSEDFESQFLEQADSSFSHIEYIDLKNKPSYSSCKGDINNDGLLDILVQMNPPEKYQLWINQNDSKNHFIKIDLQGIVSNRSGFGSHVVLFSDDSKQYQQTYCNTGFLAQDSHSLHFGLGEKKVVDSISILWPSGHRDMHYTLKADTTYHFKEGGMSGVIQVDPNINLLKEVTVSTSTSYQESTIKIYPNPAKDIINIFSADQFDQIKIYTRSGNLIDTIDKEDTVHYIDIANYADGSYLIVIRYPNRNIRSLYFIKV